MLRAPIRLATAIEPWPFPLPLPPSSKSSFVASAVAAAAAAAVDMDPLCDVTDCYVWPREGRKERVEDG